MTKISREEASWDYGQNPIMIRGYKALAKSRPDQPVEIIASRVIGVRMMSEQRFDVVGSIATRALIESLEVEIFGEQNNGE